MAKTLVIPEHAYGPHENGYDGCFARWGAKVEGTCPGVENAKWLNGLGEDDEQYAVLGGEVITNGRVRDNWINSHSGHVLAANPKIAKLRASVRRASADLRRLRRELRTAEKFIDADRPEKHNVYTDAVRTA